MPFVEVWVDAVDLDDFSDDELRDEMSKREQKKNPRREFNCADYAIPRPVAREALNHASDILRQTGKLDLAFKLEEIREDFVGH